VRNALATVAARPDAAAVTVHLNELSDSVLARAALLLHLSEALNPASEEDMRFLFAVWFCAVLSGQHADRLRAVVRQLLAGAAGARVGVGEGGGGGGDSGLRERLKAVWSGWLDCGKSTTEVQAARWVAQVPVLG